MALTILWVICDLLVSLLYAFLVIADPLRLDAVHHSRFCDSPELLKVLESECPRLRIIGINTANSTQAAVCGMCLARPYPVAANVVRSVRGRWNASPSPKSKRGKLESDVKCSGL